MSSTHLPQSLEDFASGPTRCDICHEEVSRRWTENGTCIGCQYRPGQLLGDFMENTA